MASKLPQESKKKHHPDHPGEVHASAPFFRGTAPGVSLFPSLNWSLAVVQNHEKNPEAAG